MDAIQAILTRRSIRRYTAAPVTDDMIDQLLKAAMSAPTAANQSWHFVVIRDKGILEEFTAFHPHAQMLRSAQAAIAVVADPTLEKMKDRWPLDCAAATENMLIAANALGLGACWVGVYPVEERMEGLRKLLGAPDHVAPLCMVALGHPDETKAPPDRFKPDRVHHDKW